jgi:hypothetical protein
VVVEPGLVVGELVVGQDAGGGPAVFLAGPLVVGAVRLRQVGWPQRVIRSARVPGSARPRAVSSRAMRAAWACWAGAGDMFSFSQPGSRIWRISLSISAA